MTPQVAKPEEFENELRGADEFLTWVDQHTHFFHAIFGKLEDLLIESQARFFFKAGLITLFRRNADQFGIPTEVKEQLDWAENLGRPNTTQNEGGDTVEKRISAGMDFSAETLHAEIEGGVKHLQDTAAHNHAVHVNKGWAYEDPRTQSTWTQYGINGPTQYDQYGNPVAGSSQFQPHAQGFAPYGQPGAPAGPVHGNHSNKGHATSNLLGKLVSAGTTVAGFGVAAAV